MHVENLLSKIATFSQLLSIFKCNPGETNDSLLLLIISTSSKGKESDELLCTVRSLVMVREPVASARV